MQSLLKIQLKIHEPQKRDKYKNIVMEKTQTVRELLAQIRRQANDDFCAGELDDVKDCNIRLRSYDSRLRILLKPYEDLPDLGKENPFDMTLLDHNFHSYFELKVEIREEGA